MNPYAAKPLAAFDTECVRDYWLIYFKEIESGRVKYFEMYDGHELDRAGILRIMRNYTLVSFNGIHYDVPMLKAALKQGATTQQLKKINDAIITGNMKPWVAEERFQLPKIDWLDHIDLIEPAPSVQVGLKLYMGRQHSTRLQDMPFDPDDLIFDGTPGKREETIWYCGNDVDGTIDLYKNIKPQIDLRCEMSQQYKVDLRSKSDAQIAEAVIRAELERISGEKLYRPELPHDYSFKYEVPSFIRFKTQQMREVLHTVRNATFVLTKKEVKSDDDSDDVSTVDGVKVKISGVQMPKEIKALKIKIGSSTYQMGIGGLHSTESRVTHASDEDYVIIDNDVASYYPAIVLNCELYPQHLGRDFLDVYRGIRDRRIAAKQAKDKVTDMTLKIVINGTFGKLGSKWSFLYAPNLMIQVTLTGQLALLMLIEELEEAGISVISANTDGIVSKVAREDVSKMREIVESWMRRTGFDMEQAVYKSVHSASVNSYIAIKATPEDEPEVFDEFPFLRSEVAKGTKFAGVKQKGLFAFVGSKGSPLEKNPTAYVCVDAVVNYLTNGTPLEETIEWCADMRRFLTVRRVTGGAAFQGEYLGKTVRWYHARGSKSYIQYATGKKTGHKVPKSDGAKPLMELTGHLYDDINYDFYIAESRKMLGELGVI